MKIVKKESFPSDGCVKNGDAIKRKTKKKTIAIIVAIVLLICFAGSRGTNTDNASEESDSSSSSKSSTVQVEAVDKSGLNAAIDRASALDQSAYTPTSYAKVDEACAAARQVADNEEATKADVDKAKIALNSALNSLEEAFDPATYQDISYSDVARNPEDCMGKKLVFSGRVLQVVEGTGVNNLRIATDGKYDDVVLVVYNPAITSSRILEDDTVTVCGKCTGLQSYKSTLGKRISIPGINAVQIEIS